MNHEELAKAIGLWAETHGKVPSSRLHNEMVLQFANAVIEECATKASRMVNGKSIAAAIRKMKSGE